MSAPGDPAPTLTSLLGPGAVPLVALAMILGTLAIAGCGDETAAASDPPVGTFRSTSNVDGEGSAFSTPVSVTIDKSSVGWRANCNSHGLRQVLITEDRIDTEDALASSTLIGCDGADKEQDRDLRLFFRSSPEWQLDGDVLTLANDSVSVTLRRDERR